MGLGSGVWGLARSDGGQLGATVLAQTSGVSSLTGTGWGEVGRCQLIFSTSISQLTPLSSATVCVLDYDGQDEGVLVIIIGAGPARLTIGPCLAEREIQVGKEGKHLTADSVSDFN